MRYTVSYIERGQWITGLPMRWPEALLACHTLARLGVSARIAKHVPSCPAMLTTAYASLWPNYRMVAL